MNKALICLVAILSLSCRTSWQWPESAPRAQNVDKVLLDDMLQHISEVNKGPDLIDIHTVLIVRNGQVVLERYWYGTGPDKIQGMASVSKSFVSALTGIAVDRGIIDIEKPVMEYFPEYRDSLDSAGEAQWDERKDGITVRHVLTMSTGLEGFSASQDRHKNEDYIEFYLNRPLEYEPGSQFRYNSTSSHLLSVLITRETGMSTRQFGEKYLFGPLGFDTDRLDWRKWNDGIYSGSNGIQITAREMARFGQMLLDRGMWRGERILPSWWIEESGASHVITDTNDYGYGFQFWTDERTGSHVYFAAGFGGNFIIINPRLNLVTVLKAANTIDSFMPYEDLYRNYIIPACR